MGRVVGIGDYVEVLVRSGWREKVQVEDLLSGRQ